MITPSEVNYVIDILTELVALTDPSEFLQEEVDQATELLESLKQYDTTEVVETIAALAASKGNTDHE